ncbi:MAG: hypothetical protein V4591_01385 [Bdellovibrionota bacterium]
MVFNICQKKLNYSIPPRSSIKKQQKINYFPRLHESTSNSLPNHNLYRFKHDLLRELVLYENSLYGSEKDNYNGCVMGNVGLIDDISEKIAFLQANKQETLVRGQNNIQVEKKANGSGYVVTIFDENKVSDQHATSIVKGGSKSVKQNVYRIDIDKKSKRIVVEHFVSVAQSSPIMRHPRALVESVLKRDGFTPIRKISKNESKKPFVRNIFVAKNHGIDFVEAYAKFSPEQKREIGKRHIEQALQNILELKYQFFDNKMENTLVRVYVTELGGPPRFEVTHIDYSAATITPNYIIGQALKLCDAEQENTIRELLQDPKYKYYRFVESFLTYLKFVVPQKLDSFTPKVEYERAIFDLHSLVLEAIPELQRKNIIVSEDVENMDKAFAEIQKHFEEAI